MSRTAMWLAAARRFVLLLLLASAVIVLVSLAGAALAGADLARAVAVGFYVAGSLLLVGSFFIGNRGPARLEGADTEMPSAFGVLGIGVTGRKLRWATREEQLDSLAHSAVFFTLGFALIVIGVIADERVRLL